jgi:ABC-type maltose transport system permease subunit
MLILLHLVPAFVCAAAAYMFAKSIREDLAAGTLAVRSDEMASGVLCTALTAAGAAISAWPVVQWGIG